MGLEVYAADHHGQILLQSALWAPVCLACCPPSPLQYEQVLTNKTRVRDGRGRPRKKGVSVRKVPSQARSQETVSIILEASARILESRTTRFQYQRDRSASRRKHWVRLSVFSKQRRHRARLDWQF